MKSINLITIIIVAVLLSALPLNAQNYCLDFDGVDDYVSFSNPVSLTGDYTIEAWFNTSVQNESMDMFAGTLSGDHGILLEMTSNGTFRFLHRNPPSDFGGVEIYSPSSYNDGNWHHVAAVKNSSDVTLYIDGINEGSSSGATNFTNPLDYVFGRLGESLSVRYFNGLLDEVRIWDTARTEVEINYYMIRSLTGSESGLTAYYNFDEGSGTTLGDSSGSGNDGTLINMTEEDWVESTCFHPIITNLSPSDNSTDISLTENLIIKFDRSVTAGIGNISIHKGSDDSIVETISANSCSITDSIVTIDPSDDLEYNTDYYVLIDSTTFMIDSIYFDGISDKTEWNFRTEEFLITNLSPVDNSVNISLTENLIILFNRTVTAGIGNISIHKGSDDSIFETIAASTCTITDSTLLIDPISNLEYYTDYYILVESNAIHDGSNHYFDAISDKTVWNFKSQNYFTDIDAGLTGVFDSSVAWGDYDNDGDLDILFTGSPTSKIYNNDSGLFTDIGAVLDGVKYSSVAWGDYDNDGDLDILLTGFDSYSNKVSKIYNNDSRIFTDIDAGLTGVFDSSVAWGDYDNDGDLDILLTGDSGTGSISKVYQNDSGVFTDIEAGLQVVNDSSVAWGDYDNDGDLDILLTGNGTSIVSIVYRNDAGIFTDIEAGLQGVHNGSVAWGDYDNDGDLDILLTGYTDDGHISKVYRNDSGVFTDIDAGLEGVSHGSVAWGDYDNDGDLDILLTGYTGDLVSRIYNNNSGVFTDIDAGLTGVFESSVAWGDYDNDGDLDILLTGHSGSGGISKIYHNNSLLSNTIPSKPSGLITKFENDSLKLLFNSATDNETPQNGLSYNVYVELEGKTLTSPMADTANGYRKIVAIGNSSMSNFYSIGGWSLENFFLPQEVSKAVSWEVQAIDHCFAGSEFASVNTTISSRDLNLITYDEMEASDPLTWEFVFTDSIIDYQLQLDDDINFGSPLEEIIDWRNKKSKSTFSIALNELTDFDSLISDTEYFWRVKPNYNYRASRYPDIPSSFIFNPTYSVPSPINVSVDGNLVTLSWNTAKDAVKGEVFNVYSTDDPYAVFPDGWHYEANVNGTEWFTVTSELKKFYCVTSTSGKEEVKTESR